MRPFEGFEDRRAAFPRSVRANSRRVFRPLRRAARLDSNLIIEFFFVFSRFEYSLKRAGYVKNNRGYAEANWSKFGREMLPRYRNDHSPAFREAATYLLDNPPKRQIVLDDDTLGWEESKPRANQTEIGWLLAIVKIVRNNLFHGGKYPYSPVSEPARDTRLLGTSITVLDGCLDWDDNVRHWYMSDLHD